MASADTDSRTKVVDPALRPRLHLVYYALAAFVLLTVCLSLWLISRVTRMYAASVAENQVWAARLNSYSALDELAAAVNAPGNDVFGSWDVHGESARLTAALNRFDRLAADIRADLEAELEPTASAPLLGFADRIETAKVALVGEADAIFDHVRKGETAHAAERMAAMDRQYAEVNTALAGLSRRVQEIQQARLDEQRSQAVSLRRLQTVIVVLIGVLVIAVTIYGHVLTRRMKDAARRTARSISALAASEARIRAIVETAFHGILTIDERGIVESANAAAGQLFACPSYELVGRAMDQVAPDLDAGTGPANGDLRALVGRPLEHAIRRPAGDDLVGMFVIVAAELPDRTMFICVVHDITERKKDETELARYREHLESLVEARTAELERSHEQLRLADRLASIGTLAAGLGHDMKNVLFPVRCRIDALDAADLGASVRQELTAIRRSVTYLQQLSDGLRLLSLDPQDADASGATTDLGAWWEEAESLLRTAMPSRSTLACDLPESLPPLLVPPHRLTQAIFNLVVNSGEVIGDGGTVTLTARALDDGLFVRLTVTDDGPGMPREVRRRALDPFFTTKTRGLSTGLGLALVHGVATSAGGTVEIDSEPGRGTSVSVTLPAAPDRADAGEPGRRRVVVTLADTRIASLIRTLVEASGVEVVGDGDPAAIPDSEIWVVDDAIGPERARRFLDGGGDRRVVAYTDQPGRWEAPEVTVARAEVGLAAIQDAIRSVL
ncbi:MAG: two-component system sensor histidine kinase NtrB [Planctomycetota bacterium]